MRFLPIVERELRVASRRPRTYWVRLLSALVGIAFAAVVLLAMIRDAAAAVGMVLFVTLSALTFLFCLLAGTRYTADCLSEEKRAGTLGLLFLTDLRGYDVVLGKLVATSVGSFYGLLATFPVLAVSLLLGGVTSGEFWRVVLVCLNTLFFSLSAGMTASAVCRDERRAMGLAFLVIALFSAGIPALAYEFGRGEGSEDLVALLLQPSPAFAYYLAFDLNFKPGAELYWGSLKSVHLAAWVLLGLAMLVVPHSWRESGYGDGAGWRGAWKRWTYGAAAERAAFRRRLLGINPFFWLVGRDRLKPVYVWLFLGSAGVVWLGGYLRQPQDWIDGGTCLLTTLILHTVLKLWLGSEACRRFVLDRRDGALEMLLSSPLSVPEILQGQQLALSRQFLGPLVAVLVVDWVFLLAIVTERDLGATYLVGMTMLPADAVALGWVGMWMGMKHPQINRATTATVMRILVVPWLIFLTAAALLAWLSLRFRFTVSFTFWLLLWLAVGLGCNLVFVRWSKHHLHRRFRERAVERFGTGGTDWTGWWPRRQSRDPLKQQPQTS